MPCLKAYSFSASIRKFKQWQDAEYRVIDVQKAMMRLPVDQVYEDREALASEWKPVGDVLMQG